jgi:1-acyl-sn-glycerol-3-phosphate acyltransferase
MKKAISKAILRMFGWKIGTVIEDIPKCVICVAPHTSNWDFLVGKIAYTALGRNANFLIKKDWFFFPLNIWFDWIGGVPVDRSKRTSVTEQMVEQFNKRETFQLAITPEGTRKKVKDWKKGFYYIAKSANVPVVMIYIDYKKKEVGYKGVYHITGNVEEDVIAIRKYYRDVTACYPENFVQI